jgi:hypothetical protein
MQPKVLLVQEQHLGKVLLIAYGVGPLEFSIKGRETIGQDLRHKHMKTSRHGFVLVI